MKAGTKKIPLIRKTSKTFLWISFVLLLVSTIALYFYVRNLLRTEVEEELYSTEARIESMLLENRPMYQLPPIVEIENVEVLGIEKLKDTLIFDPSQNEIEEFRELTTYSNVNGRKYQITVRALVVESEDILIAVVISYLIIIALVFLFLFYFNKARNKRLWNPFFRNLAEMKNFSLTSEKPIELLQSDVLEFDELNTEIRILTDKVRSDYKNLKQYTEDVSHEMQTPLALIQAKIENIINDTDLSDSQYEQLTSIQKDIYRLTQMNKRLTLLTKIENQQFANPEVLDLRNVVEKRIANFNELFHGKIKFDATNTVHVKMDRYLADVLCDNLISNAIKYSTAKKAVRISIEDKTLTVFNEGGDPLRNPEKLFTRFYRETAQTKSTGLGLAIVQKICDLYGYRPSYTYVDHRHAFKIDFN